MASKKSVWNSEDPWNPLFKQYGKFVKLNKWSFVTIGSPNFPEPCDFKQDEVSQNFPKFAEASVDLWDAA